MIRVYRLDRGEPLTRVPARAPDLSAANGVELRLRARRAGYADSELTALERAFAELRHDDADVLLAASGVLYRIFPGMAAGPVERTGDGAAAPTPLANERGASLLVVDTSESIAPLGDLLRFLGYDATTAVLDAPDAERIGEAAARAEPLLVVLGSHVAAAIAADESRRAALVAFCRERALGAVVVGKPVAGLDAALHLPIASRELAATLDPLVRQARARREKRVSVTEPAPP